MTLLRPGLLSAFARQQLPSIRELRADRRDCRSGKMAIEPPGAAASRRRISPRRQRRGAAQCVGADIPREHATIKLGSNFVRANRNTPSNREYSRISWSQNAVEIVVGRASPQRASAQARVRVAPK